MRNWSGWVWRGLAAVAAAGGPALGQEQRGPTPVGGSAGDWSVQFEPSVWFVAPGGKVGLPGGTAGARLEDVNLDSPRLSPAGELRLVSGDWTVSISGLAMELNDRGFVADRAMSVGGLALAAGDRAESSIDFKSFEAVAAWAVPLDYRLVGSPGGPYSARLDILGGARAFDVGFDISSDSGSASGDGFWLTPIVGSKLTLDFSRRFTVDLQVDVGAFTDGDGHDLWTFDIWAGFMYRPTDNLGVQIGYRDLAFDLSTGDGSDRFVYRGALQGLYAGAVLRF